MTYEALAGFDSTDPSTWPPTIVLNVGLCSAAACTAQDDSAVTGEINTQHPTGIGKWKLADDEYFSDGTSANPLPCPDSPDRRHVLFLC